ncbi:MAG TPA: OB-fold nucleic acid binding domain-containing protein [Thermoanaerobaculia bacterium]
MRTLTIAGMMLLALAACSKTEQPLAQAASTTAAETTSVAEMGGAIMESVEGEKVSGTVVESHTASGFTYVLLDHGKSKEWYVLGPLGVKKGEKLEVETRMVAEKFESKSLKRTFDKVTFARVISGGTPVPLQPSQEHAAGMMAAGMPAGHPPTDGANPHGAMGMGMPGAAKPADLGPINVAKAEGADGRTIAEVWATRTKLTDSKIAVRGKVVKASNGIMGMNWIHIRDGSGSEEKGDNDLTITTHDTAKVGDVILVNGTLRVDKDFGAGYEYPVIVEDGKIRK